MADIVATRAATSATIRRAVRADAGRLAALKATTFRETFIDGFGIPYPPDDLAAFSAAHHAPAAARAQIADPDCATWVVADGDVLIGYAHVGPCGLPHPDVRPGDGELRQIYLTSAAQGLGLGRTLMARALDHLAATRPGPVWLGVWSGNHRAQAIYRRLGFTHVGDYEFAVGRWIDHEHIYRR